MPSNSLWPQFHHALPALFGSRASAVMGCDGCLRAVLWENRVRCGPVFAHTMGKGVASSLQALKPPSVPLPLTSKHTSSSLYLFLLAHPFFIQELRLRKTQSHTIPLFFAPFMPSPPLVFCKAFVSRICWSPSRGILLAAPKTASFFHHIPMLGHCRAGLMEPGVTAKEVNSEVLATVLHFPHAAHGNSRRMLPLKVFWILQQNKQQIINVHSKTKCNNLQTSKAYILFALKHTLNNWFIY